MNAGDRFRGYRILRRLGEGGTGEVYLARHDVLGVNYAIKVIARDVLEASEESRQRFFREVQIAAGIRHPSLVSVSDAGFDEATELYFIVMDYMPGGTVAVALARERRFSVVRALGVVQSVARGLEELNRNGIVHRDVKPGNMLIDANGAARLSDPGFAKVSGRETRTITETGFSLGTPSYMPFEQIVDSHAVDIRADIYALGVSLFEMLTGSLPDGDLSSSAIIKKRVDGVPLPDIRTVNRAIPDRVADLVARMVEPDVAKRIRTPQEVVLEAKRLLDALKPVRNRIVPADTVRRVPSSGWKYMLAGALMAGFAIAVTLAFVWSDRIGKEIETTCREDETPEREDGNASIPEVEPLEAASAAPPSVRQPAESRIREVTNEIVKIVTVTNVVREVGTTNAVAVGEPDAGFSPEPLWTNVVENVVVVAPNELRKAAEGISEMIAQAGIEMRVAHGLRKGVRVQDRVATIMVVTEGDRYRYDSAACRLTVPAGYGGFPWRKEKMARMCVGFMGSYGEGPEDQFSAIVSRFVRMKMLVALVPDRREKLLREAAKSALPRLLQYVAMDDPEVLPRYFRLRREAYAQQKIFNAMSIHDFAAIVSLAYGKNVFPYLRRQGLKADEFATNLNVRGLPRADFFGE